MTWTHRLSLSLPRVHFSVFSTVWYSMGRLEEPPVWRICWADYKWSRASEESNPIAQKVGWRCKSRSDLDSELYRENGTWWGGHGVFEGELISVRADEALSIGSNQAYSFWYFHSWELPLCCLIAFWKELLFSFHISNCWLPRTQCSGLLPLSLEGFASLQQFFSWRPFKQIPEKVQPCILGIRLMSLRTILSRWTTFKCWIEFKWINISVTFLTHMCVHMYKNRGVTYI